MSARIATVVVLSLVALGCGPSPQAQVTLCSTQAAPPPDGLAQVHLGPGTVEAFVRFKEGDSAKLDYGSQGGQHIWVDVQSYTPKKTTWKYDIRLSDSKGTEVARAYAQSATCGAGWSTLTNQRVIFDSFPTLETAMWTLKVTADDGAGTVITESVKIYVVS